MLCHKNVSFVITENPITPQNIANPLSTSFREITSKLHTTGLISQFVDGELSIHTDTTCVVSAEEAVESPEKSADSDSPDYQKKIDMYNKIGQREFEDTILFKHHRRKKKKMPMSVSVSSLSSSGSDERESTYTQPTLMSLSAVGVLPDLRSPESIRNDIEYKEKILANVLNFDKVCVEVETDCDLNQNDAQIGEEIKGENVQETVVVEEEEEEVISSKEEFSIKPFKHIFPEFDKIKFEDVKVAEAPGRNNN